MHKWTPLLVLANLARIADGKKVHDNWSMIKKGTFIVRLKSRKVSPPPSLKIPFLMRVFQSKQKVSQLWIDRKWSSYLLEMAHCLLHTLTLTFVQCCFFLLEPWRIEIKLKFHALKKTKLLLIDTWATLLG